MKYFIIALISGIIIFVAISSVTRKEQEEEKFLDTREFNGSTYTLELTENGYVPADIIIEKGDKIIFSTDATYTKLHWPASNLHPTHGVYKEFDPLSPIENTKTWEFVFENKGEWKFHDHLAPYYTGTIVVK